jgi:hypothetical protein
LDDLGLIDTFLLPSPTASVQPSFSAMSFPLRIAFPFLVVAGALAGVCRADTTVELIDLAPRIQPNSLTRVTVELDAGGNDVVRASESRESATKTGDEQKLPMSVSARLQYDERRLDGGDATSSRPLAIRYYTLAEGTLKVDTSGHAPKLADNRRLIVVAPGSVRPNLCSPNGPLTRQELDLIDVAGNSCLIDDLLPAKPVVNGATWNHDAKLMGALLAVDSVAACEVQSVQHQFREDPASRRCRRDQRRGGHAA